MAVNAMHIKSCVVGDDGIGKTSLLHTLANGAFPGQEDLLQFNNYSLNLTIDGASITFGICLGPKWVPELTHHMATTPIVLVGLKTDTRVDKSVLEDLASKNIKPISFDEGRAKANELGLRRYVECSSLTRKGIDELVQDSALIVLEPRSYPRNTTRSKKCILM